MDDLLHDAERQMAEHELSSLSVLLAKLLRHLDLGSERSPTPAEITAAVERLSQEDPDARAALEALATFDAARRED